jgi:hypothetical protein
MVKKGKIRKVDYKALLQAVPIGEENSLPLRSFVLKFGYAYSTTSSALLNLIRAGKIKRKLLKVYLYWRKSEEEKKLHEDKTAKGGNQMEGKDRLRQRITEEIKSREEYDIFAKSFLSPDVQRLFLQKRKDYGIDLPRHLQIVAELQTALDLGCAKEWVECQLPITFEKFNRLYQEVMEGVETETEEETEVKHPQKHDLIALKEEVSKLEDRIAELEGESEYIQVSQKKNELEARATALEKQLKKMQEEEWKVREDMK